MNYELITMNEPGISHLGLLKEKKNLNRQQAVRHFKQVRGFSWSNAEKVLKRGIMTTMLMINHQFYGCSLQDLGQAFGTGRTGILSLKALGRTGPRTLLLMPCFTAPLITWPSIRFPQLLLASDSVKGSIIGQGGRNIATFEKATGVEIRTGRRYLCASFHSDSPAPRNS